MKSWVRNYCLFQRLEKGQSRLCPLWEGCPKPDAGPPGIRIYQRQDVRMSEASLYKKKDFFVTMDGDGW